MKPFSLEIRDLYLHSGPVWEYTASEEFPSPFDEIKHAWKVSFNEELPDLPEPYDFQKGSLLYVFPSQRYLYVEIEEGHFKSAEIREIQDVFILRKEPRVHPNGIISCFNARSPSHAILKAHEFVLHNHIEGAWTLWHQVRDTSQEAQIIYRSTNS